MPPTMAAGTQAGFMPKDYTPGHDTADPPPAAAGGARGAVAAAAGHAAARRSAAGAARHRDLPRADEDRERRARDRAGGQHHEQPRLRQPAVLHAGWQGRAVHVGQTAAGDTQTDIYRYDIASQTDLAGDERRRRANTRRRSRRPGISRSSASSSMRTRRSVSGSSPPTGAIRVRCWRRSSPSAITRGPTTQSLALFVLGQPATLQLADTRTGTAVDARHRHRPFHSADPRRGPAGAGPRRSASSSANETRGCA